MKINCWLTLGVMVALSAVAQDNTNSSNTLPPIPAPSAAVAPAPATEPAAAPAVAPAPAPVKKKKVAPAKPLHEPPVSLVPGPAEVKVNVNARGQAGLKGEVVSHLKKGESVNVLEQINLDKHKVNEPAQWAKIALPSSIHVWVKASYIDANKAVTPKKLNLRSGPGENFSVLGVVEKGTTVNEITSKNGWMQIDPPANTYAFVAAMYLKQEAQALPPPPPTPEGQTAMNPPPVPPEQMPRVVSHEGVVRGTVSPQAPTKYELYDPATGVNINYLYTTSPNLDLSKYVNMRIIVTGEEGLDKRWSDTPLINIQSIQVIAQNAVQRPILRTPRQSQAH
jgi:uncharacterized protein YgiM (DUF1202 family)